jgi:hypothetical protein
MISFVGLIFGWIQAIKSKKEVFHQASLLVVATKLYDVMSQLGETASPLQASCFYNILLVNE